MAHCGSAVDKGNDSTTRKWVSRCPSCNSGFLLPIPRCLVCDEVMATPAGVKQRLALSASQLRKGLDTLWMAAGCADVSERVSSAIATTARDLEQKLQNELDQVHFLEGALAQICIDNCADAGHHAYLRDWNQEIWLNYTDHLATSPDSEAFMDGEGIIVWLRNCLACGATISRLAPAGAGR